MLFNIRGGVERSWKRPEQTGRLKDFVPHKLTNLAAYALTNSNIYRIILYRNRRKSLGSVDFMPNFATERK